MYKIIDKTPVTKKTNSRIISLQVIRALACSAIVLMYLGIIPVAFSTWAVSVFFVLSGFLMVINYFDVPLSAKVKNSFQFSLRKIAKLYPLHLLMTIAALPLSLIVLLRNFSLNSLVSFIARTILNVSLLQAWIPNSDTYYFANGVSWYLSASLFLYFAFPFILKAIKKIKNNTTAVCSMIVIFLIQIIFGYLSSKIIPQTSFINNFTKWFVYIFPLFRLGDFTIGALLGYLFINRKNEITKLTATISEFLALVLTLSVILIYTFKFESDESIWYGYSLIYLPISLLLVYAFALNRGMITKILQNKVVLWVGNMSAYLYLCHQVVWSYVNLTSDFIPNKWIRAIITIIITIIGIVVYRKIEAAWKEHRAKRLQ